MDIDRVRELADGRIYTANQALEVDLIDGVATYDEAAAIWQTPTALAMPFYDISAIKTTA